jgi:transposase-like protein
MSGSLSDRKAGEWQQRFMRFQKCPKTVEQFCRQEGVSPASFYLWRNRLGRGRGHAPKALESAASASQSPAGFRPVRLLTPASLSVHLPGGTRLVVPMSEPEGLRSVIDAVARADAEHRAEARPC